MNKDEIKTVLELHVKWLNGEEEGIRANLRSADLSYADLSSADLSGADLSYADLGYADLSGADLRSANLRGADLSGADLSYADLRGANLSSANLRGADLSGATGVLRSECAWTDHGECGRNLLCVMVGESPRYFCGCFSGTEAELRAYIEAGDANLRASRTIALDFCAARMSEMIAKRKNEKHD